MRGDLVGDLVLFWQFRRRGRFWWSEREFGWRKKWRGVIVVVGGCYCWCYSGKPESERRKSEG